ncbi:prepilin-type N-terminal cleavage/methylation domain-containing protein [Pseudomonas sp. MAP12]|uniref:Prepilin-type N-terminal cleavage/methylation domain-containing protein n=1 Tax=Geopseudomonas aromaticivorans TaxID=2849492 RepID=A0ABS6MS16_9GAMM|nr:prepilin-type N-terminal cleavage/methylation domain-containing protein [Pseudomonas aromaticivorans]MBV2131598.1 prepilin-type N-terminal cleavage/methylation domain-containing protein [Pseudomonas aromaticivorans]
MKRMTGFTLIELLVAMSLATLVSLLAYSGLQVAIGVWHAADQRQREMENNYLVTALLRRLLESPEEVSVRDEEDVQQLAFRGDEESLIFAAQLPALDDTGKVYWVQLIQEKQLSTEGQRWQLLMRYMPLVEMRSFDWSLLVKDLADYGEEKVLLEGQPRSLRFAYLEQLAEGGSEWQTEWLQLQRLPALIRITPARRKQGALAQVVVAPRNMAYAILKGK